LARRLSASCGFAGPMSAPQGVLVQAIATPWVRTLEPRVRWADLCDSEEDDRIVVGEWSTLDSLHGPFAPRAPDRDGHGRSEKHSSGNNPYGSGVDSGDDFASHTTFTSESRTPDASTVFSSEASAAAEKVAGDRCDTLSDNQPSRLTQQVDKAAAEIGLARFMVSAGSAGHVEGQCKPCLFFASPDGCAAGTGCSFCHFPHSLSGNYKRPSKRKRSVYTKLVGQNRALLEATGAREEP